MKPLLEKYLPLSPNSSSSTKLSEQRKKDHYSHFILRLAFSSTDDLRRRFARVETMLFRLRFDADTERSAFVSSLDIDWFEPVSDEEQAELRDDLQAIAGFDKRTGAVEETWYKVDWMRVPDLVESRKVLLRGGKAYVPSREQASMIITEFTSRLEKQLVVSLNSLFHLRLSR